MGSLVTYRCRKAAAENPQQLFVNTAEMSESSFAFAAKNVFDLVSYYSLNVCASDFQIFARVKDRRISEQCLADTCRQAKTKVGVDVILQTAERAASRSWSSGTPMASLRAPPFALMILTYSCGTEDAP